MNGKLRGKLAPALVALSLATTSGCSVWKGLPNAGKSAPEQREQDLAAEPNGDDNGAAQTQSAAHAQSLPESMNGGAGEAVIPMISAAGGNYVPLRSLADLLQLNTDWDAAGQTLKLGDNDFEYSVTIGARQAVRDGEPVTLSAEPILQQGTAYLPVAGVADLLREEMNYEVRDDRFIVHPFSGKIVDLLSAASAGGDSDGLSFGDDPADPFRDTGTASAADEDTPAASRQAITDDVPAAAVIPEAEAEPEAAEAAAKNIDIAALTRKGKQYVGVPYQLGAAPYPQSGKFDCSSFTRYVFAKYRLALPQSARQQAQRGTVVSRKNLRKGDLMFFSVPSRFRSNRTVGHVGIYLGGNLLLHAAPKPKDGVQITNIDKPYWKETFLFAKRVVY